MPCLAVAPLGFKNKGRKQEIKHSALKIKSVYRTIRELPKTVETVRNNKQNQKI